MRSFWLMLAWLALSGCFGSHGMPREDGGIGAGDGAVDAGPTPSDAGPGCVRLPASVMDIECSLQRTGEGFAIITTSPTRCCESGTPTPTVSTLGTSTGTAHDVAIEWTACDCCEGCRCVGPIETISVPLGRLGPGHHVVTAHGATCTLDVGPPPMCVPATADETLISRVLLADQPLAVTLTQRDGRGGCGCSPSIASLGDGWDFAMELCDCCFECDCVDLGYQAHASVPTPPVGDHSVVIPHGVATLSVRERERCRPIEATSLRVVTPDLMLRQGGPPQTWAIVGGVETLCCAEPMPAVEVGVGPAGEVVLSILSCVEADCDCVGAPVRFEARVSLGTLGSGEHVLRAGPFEERVRVD